MVAVVKCGCFRNFKSVSNLHNETHYKFQFPVDALKQSKTIFQRLVITNSLLRPLLWQIKSETTIYSLQENVAMIREKSPAIHHQDIIINCPIRGDIIAASTNAKASRRNGGRRGWQSVAEDLWHSVVAALSLNVAKVKTTYSIQFLLSQLFSALVWVIL